MPRACSNANAALVRSPGDSSLTGRLTWSARNPNFASRVRTSALVKSGTNSSKRSASGRGPVKCRRDWSISPIATLALRRASPLSGSRSPNSRRNNVDLPAPLGPVIPIRSPALTCSDTGPRTKSPRRTTASLSVDTTELDRGAEPIVNSRTHSLRGSTTSSSRAIRLSICRTFCACFSLDSLAARRRCLSLSGALRIALRTP